jgi:hypothetical protein
LITRVLPVFGAGLAIWSPTAGGFRTPPHDASLSVRLGEPFSLVPSFDVPWLVPVLQFPESSSDPAARAMTGLVARIITEPKSANREGLIVVPSDCFCHRGSKPSEPSIPLKPNALPRAVFRRGYDTWLGRSEIDDRPEP